MQNIMPIGATVAEKSVTGYSKKQQTIYLSYSVWRVIGLKAENSYSHCMLSVKRNALLKKKFGEKPEGPMFICRII